MWNLLPWLLTMLVLIACSAFFSSSEAAYFSLRAGERRALAIGSTGERRAYLLLKNPDRLLSAVLFWNLVINVTYFAISSIVSIRLDQMDGVTQTATVAFALGSLLTLIFFSEMLPKSIAVLRAKSMSALVSFPLSASVRMVDPLLPAMTLSMLVSQRMIMPRMKREDYMDADDLRQAIEVSTLDKQLVQQEQAVLTNIVELSNIRVDEWMLPRSQFQAFKPPVSLNELKAHMPDLAYLLITEPDNDEIASAIHLNSLWDIRDDHLEYLAEPVLYVPWCTTVADCLERMRQRDREVAAVVNEFGDTIGILTFEDILDTLFNYSPSRSKGILDQNPVHKIGRGRWLVSGMTGLRRLANELDVQVPATHHVTVCGVIQEAMQRLAQTGDECDWGPFRFRVLEMPSRGHLLVQVEMNESARGEDG